MAIHSSQYSWKMSWTEESGGLSPWGHKESDVTEHTRPCFIFPVPFPGETVDLLTVKPLMGMCQDLLDLSPAPEVASVLIHLGPYSIPLLRHFSVGLPSMMWKNLVDSDQGVFRSAPRMMGRVKDPALATRLRSLPEVPSMPHNSSVPLNGCHHSPVT